MESGKVQELRLASQSNRCKEQPEKRKSVPKEKEQSQEWGKKSQGTGRTIKTGMTCSEKAIRMSVARGLSEMAEGKEEITMGGG